MKKEVSSTESLRKNRENKTNHTYIPTTSFSPAHPPKPQYTSSHLKSPSPDDHHSNMLTPSKVKYFGENSHNRCIDRTPYSSQKKFTKIFDSIDHTKQQQHIKELQDQINILTIQNKHLVKRIEQLTEKSKQNLPKSQISYESSGKSHQNGVEGGRRNMLIIEKIKEQYRQNLSTLKLMIEQEVRQNSCIIQGACKLLQSKVNQLQSRVQDAEKVAHLAKVRYILSQQQKLAESYENSQSSPLKSNRQIPDNTISDILCVSIPQEQWQESKNSMAVSKLQGQIERLRRTINQTENAYVQQKAKHFEAISIYKHKVEELEKQLADVSKQKKSNERSERYQEFHQIIKQQLKNLQQSVSEMAQELLRSKQLCNKTLLDMEQKNNELQIASRQIIILRDKIVDLEKHRSLLEQKNRFLQRSLGLAQRQLKQRKQMLDNALNAQSILAKEKLLQYQKNLGRFGQENVSREKNSLLEITTRIDRIIKLQNERESQLLNTVQQRLQKISDEKQRSQGLYDSQNIENSQNY